MADMSPADIEQIYVGGLLLRNGVLVRIRSYDHEEDTVKIYNLATKRVSEVKFKPTDYRPINRRIGMVNVGKAVVYVSRTTLRQYKMGLTSNNCSIEAVHSVYYPLGRDQTRRIISTMEAVELVKAYENDYPPLEEAYKKALAQEGICAFDKQFAVDAGGRVYYKTIQIGEYKNGAIIFDHEHQYLNILLDKGYEKDSRTFKATPLRR